MPDQHLSLSGLAVESENPATEPPFAAPVNRAERRGKAKKQSPAEQRYLGSVGHARPAQGRRVNPVRRSG